MRRTLTVLAVLVAFGAVTVSAASNESNAVPSFTRQTGMTCAQCHVMFGAPVPNFTFTGKKFRINGYRVPFVTERIEAGEEGALSGKRLSVSLFPYLSLRYQSVFAAQAKAPGAAEAGPITSNPTSRLAIFTGGPVADYFGLWTEMYLTPDGSPSGEWTLGLFSLDEVKLLLDLSVGEHCAETRTFARQKKGLVEKKIADLRNIQAALDKLIRACGTGRGGRGCPIIESLSRDTDLDRG